MKPTLKGVLAELQSKGDEKVRTHNAKAGAGPNQFGVRHGDIRALATRIKLNHELAGELWESGNLDAQLLATLLFKPSNLTDDDLQRMIRSITCAPVADWFATNVLKKYPHRERLREPWMQDDNPWAARAGWSLTAERINKAPDGLELAALLQRIESEMPRAEAVVQWTMNLCLAGIGIHFPKHRPRAISIGEALGIYRNYPVSKGCTSPFAPLWIAEMVRRQK